MRVLKILNNNYLLVEDENGREQIVMGKGLRFCNEAGKELKGGNIQKVFLLKDKKAVRDWEQMLENVPESYAEAIHLAISLADEAMPITGEVPSAINPPRGCRFHPRCECCMERCKTENPEMREVDGRLVGCHLYE